MRYSVAGWLAIGALVVGIETFAPSKDELLSRQMDRWRQGPIGRYVATGIVIVTASHLLRTMPPVVDPFTWALRWKH